MPTIHGKNGQVYLQGAGTEAILISEAAEYSIDLDFELDPDPAMGDTWRTQNKGLAQWKGSLNGNLDTAATTVLDAFLATTPRKFYLYPDRAITANYYYGTIWPKFSIKGGTKSNVGFSGSFDGDGAFGSH